MNQFCCFTGHRKLSSTEESKLKKRLEDEIKYLVDQGVTTFLCGGALGFDTIAAICVLKMKHVCPKIQLWLVLPCRDQTRSWTESSRACYEQIKWQADRITYTSESYWPGCMQKRNRFLASHSGWCICYLNQPGGGTKYTVEICRKFGVQIINLADE